MTAFDNDDVTYDDNPPEESNNRTFLFVAGGLGVLVLLAILCLAGYFIFFSGNASQSAEETALAQATQQAATIQVGLTQTAIAQALTVTAGATATLPPTSTPVIN